MKNIETKNVEIAGGIIISKEKKILLVYQYGSSWCFPKGHVEESETLEETAKREIEEETGITDIVFLQKLPEYQRYRMGKNNINDFTELKTIHIFICSTNQLDLDYSTEEVTETRWFDFNEALKILTNEKDREFFDTYSETIKTFL